MRKPLGRLKQPKIVIDIPVAYIIWLFAQADFGWRAISRELPGVAPSNIRRLIDRNRWSRNMNYAVRGSCENLAFKYCEFFRQGRTIDIMPIPAEHIAMMGQIMLDESDLRILRVDGSESDMNEIGDGAPDPRATISEARKKGAGPEHLLAAVAEMLTSEMLAVPNKMGVTLIPIPADAIRIKADSELGADGLGNPVKVEDYIGGVMMMGRPWDKSYIVPDTKRRSDGVKLAASTFGITDKDQLDHIIKKHRMAQNILDSEWKDAERRRKAEDMRKQEEILRGKKVDKDVSDAELVGKIAIYRPKQLTPAQWKAEKEIPKVESEA